MIAEDGANDIINYPIKFVKGKLWVNNHAHVVAVKSTENSNHFLSYSLQTYNFEPLLVGGGRAKLNLSAMLNVEIKLPNIKEQVQISRVMSSIDSFITLHQRVDSFFNYWNLSGYYCGY